MTNRSEPDDLHLPPELAALDSELRSLAYEERPSFGPELEAELEREWRRVRHRPAFPARQLMAAGVAGLLMVGLGVPSARASLVKLLSSFQEPASQEVVVPPPALGGALFYEVPATPLQEEAEPLGEAAPEVPIAPPPVPEPEVRTGYVGPAATLPRLLDRELLRAVVADSYPEDLLDARVGGTVRLLLWVDSTGVVDFVNVGQSSGRPAFDRAALEVAPTFRFEPARRWGTPVGTWVEFDLVFEPGEAGAPPADPPGRDSESPSEARPPGVH